tara:strand:- start:2677 stop:3459 length:783 start_codon:yes stop_codon:yes gene_type:complete
LLEYTTAKPTKIDGELIVREYFKTPSESTKSKVVTAFIPLVYKIVNRMNLPSSNILSKDDLVQIGLVGLIEALNRFDISAGIKFKSFAYTRINGAVIDEIRKSGIISRGKLSKLIAIEKITSRLSQDLGRDPIVIEICEKANITEDDYHQLMGIAQLSYTLSLDEKVEGNEDEEAMTRIESVKDKNIDTPEDLIMQDSLKNDVMECVKSLPDRERLALVLYYYEELTLQEIANVIGVSESRVSQILNKTLMKIRLAVIEN